MVPVAKGQARASIDPLVRPLETRTWCSAPSTPSAMGSIIAAVAVLLTHIEISAVTAPRPASMRAG
jgi:hypothetical protein